METANLNLTGPTMLDLLLSRRSGSAKAMTEPGPSKEQLAQILRAGARVPDHGKLFPWRFIVFEAEGIKRFADILVDALTEDGMNPSQIEEWRALRAANPNAQLAHLRSPGAATAMRTRVIGRVCSFAQSDGRGSGNPLRWTILPIHRPACTAARR